MELLENTRQRHREYALGGRGDLNSLTDMIYEIAALPPVVRNDNKINFVNKPIKSSANITY